MLKRGGRPSLLHPQLQPVAFLFLFALISFFSIPLIKETCPQGSTRRRELARLALPSSYCPFLQSFSVVVSSATSPSLPLTHRGLIWYHLLPSFLLSVSLLSLFLSLSFLFFCHLPPFLFFFFSLFLFLRPGSLSYPSIDRIYLSATMPFFSNFRRRSKASFKSNDTRSNESQSNGDVTSGQSSSTLDTSSHSSVTPPSSIKPNGTSSSPNLPALNEAPITNGSSTSSGGTNTPATVPPQRPGQYVTPFQRNSTFVRNSTPLARPDWVPTHIMYKRTNQNAVANRVEVPYQSTVLPGRQRPLLPTLRELSPSRMVHG